MISDLRLQRFRSYSDESFEFCEAVNVIVGPNGSGKTNLLEAVLMVARGSSYRVNDSDLLQFGASWFRLDAHVQPGEIVRTVKLVSESHLVKKTYEFGGKTYQRLTINHLLPVVLFEPNHLLLLHGAPELRRNYLDDILEQTLTGFTGLRRNYRRLLSQRNALLRRASPPSSQELFPWNLRLSELGATIARMRFELCETINQTVSAIYNDIAQSATVITIAYHPKLPIEQYETYLLQRLESHLREDISRGFTTYGPHREDFTIAFDGRPADEFASRGETRTAILVLKIIELQLLEGVHGQAPLLLLDDVFSELDGRRRQSLVERLVSYQTFITTTDIEVVTGSFRNNTVISLGGTKK